MLTTRPSSLMRSVHVRLFKLVFGWGYRKVTSAGSWREPLVEAIAARPGERILEVSAEGCSVCAGLARQYPAARFSALQSAGANKIVGEPLGNLDLVLGDQSCIDCRAASFDKVVCSLALHPLPQDKKLALLKEMRRLLRHGGTLHLADFDQPLLARESSALRGTAFLFGRKTAKSHSDGSWLNLIKQAGFVGVRRGGTFSDIVGRIAIVRARRG